MHSSGRSRRDWAGSFRTGEAADRSVCVRESWVVIGRVDFKPVVDQPEILGDPPGRDVVLGDPGDRGHGVVKPGRQRQCRSCDFSGQTLPLMVCVYAVVEVPRTGSLPLDPAHPDDRVVIA